MESAAKCAPKALAAREPPVQDLCLPGHKPIRLKELQIPSPKRSRKFQSGWEGFFPYYAGYPEIFAREVLGTAKLPPGAVVLDPWNGSGTTTLVASRLGLTACGLDLNPVMVIVARARLLPLSEAGHLTPLAATILSAKTESPPVTDTDPLLDWFEPEMAATIRTIARNIGCTLLGESAVSPDGARSDQLSATTATFYVALFAACRRMVRQFIASNPTWLRRPRAGEAKVTGDPALIGSLFQENVATMTNALSAISFESKLAPNRANPQILAADSTSFSLPKQSVDFVLTSPPYCTRIDYTAATRIELAVLDPLVSLKVQELKRKMVGSIQVPINKPEPRSDWGPTSLNFLERLRSHPSK